MLHGGSYPRAKVIGDINYTIHNLIKVKFEYTTIPNFFPQMVALLDGYRPSFQFKLVKWFPPPYVCAKGVKLAEFTSLVAEATAIKEGLQYCWKNNYLNIILESDSLAMNQILNGVWEILWSMTIVVNSINRLREVLSVIMNINLFRKFQVQEKR
ncbi:hypothetical protein KY290_034020 [Solanum tuberosum]|uniref:RNase H type-1 domain-containing protein n=1 Tax=Solanum tuberosum TaxID=4113 RepID=A0ABQ7U200_SOLTU|nr:hypothetical protein KY289_033401 [Solanum tuberosum]KAH0740977.1 hypothetical protein KY290_034020 [Solanum tuberosum]